MIKYLPLILLLTSCATSQSRRDHNIVEGLDRVFFRMTREDIDCLELKAQLYAVWLDVRKARGEE